VWVHEGWTTYLECLYVEYMYGKEDGLKYTNGYQSKVRNQQPIIAPRSVNATPPQDFKGALFLNTLRSVVNDDARWWSLLKDFYQHFKYQTIMTEDIVAWFNQKMKMNLSPIFDQYLRHIALPKLELKFDEAAGTVSYRWKVDEPAFAMPVRVGTKEHWEIIRPTTEWKAMKTTLKRDQFEVATDSYFVEVTKL
jgi:aminopeptidase N